MMSRDIIYVLWSDDGRHLRKFDFKPFDGGERFVSARLAPAPEKVVREDDAEDKAYEAGQKTYLNLKGIEGRKGCEFSHEYAAMAVAQDALKAYRAAFAQPEAARVGGDFVLVPREPTQAMLDAGRNAANDKRWAYCGYGPREEGTGLDGMEFYVRGAYRAMLAALATQPAAGAEG